MTYKIVFTTHDSKILSIHGGGRLYNLGKTELSILSFISLIDSFKHAKIVPEIYIIADRLTSRLTDFFMNQKITEFIEVKPHGDIDALGLGVGQYLSWLNVAYNKIITFNPEDIICHVEDDYIFLKESIIAIDEIFTNQQKILHGYENTDFILHPSNEPSMYLEDSTLTQGKLDYRLFHSKHRVWAQSNSSHHTFFYKQKLIQNEYIKKAYINNDVHDREPQLWEFTKRNLGLRPIPSLANHMNPINNDPHVDWAMRISELFNEYNLGQY